MKVTIAVVQTVLDRSERCHKINMERASGYIDDAVSAGAQIVCFPETYPGPWKEPMDFSPHEELAAKAREKGIYLLYGTAEKAEGHPGRHRIVEVLIGPQGQTVGKYMRTSPLGPWIYPKSSLWDLNYLEADELPVFETELGTIGIIICSEVYVPELSRILAVKGAEIIFMPAGAYKAQLYDSWRTLIWARAIENLAYTATCQNLLGAEDGLAMIAGPEEVLAESADECVLVATVDLDRARKLREMDDVYTMPLPFRTKPGIFRKWRRPEIYGELTVPRGVKL